MQSGDANSSGSGQGRIFWDEDLKKVGILVIAHRLINKQICQYLWSVSLVVKNVALFSGGRRFEPSGRNFFFSSAFAAVHT